MPNPTTSRDVLLRCLYEAVYDAAQDPRFVTNDGDYMTMAEIGEYADELCENILQGMAMQDLERIKPGVPVPPMVFEVDDVWVFLFTYEVLAHLSKACPAIRPMTLRVTACEVDI